MKSLFISPPNFLFWIFLLTTIVTTPLLSQNKKLVTTYRDEIDFYALYSDHTWHDLFKGTDLIEGEKVLKAKDGKTYTLITGGKWKPGDQSGTSALTKVSKDEFFERVLASTKLKTVKFRDDEVKGEFIYKSSKYRYTMQVRRFKGYKKGYKDALGSKVETEVPVYSDWVSSEGKGNLSSVNAGPIGMAYMVKSSGDDHRWTHYEKGKEGELTSPNGESWTFLLDENYRIIQILYSGDNEDLKIKRGFSYKY